MPDRTTLNLIGAVISLIGSLQAVRKTSGLARARAGLGLATSAFFVYNAFSKRGDEQLA